VPFGRAAARSRAPLTSTTELNDIIRVLTILSAVMLPLTLITGIYGMNTETLPFAHSGVFSFFFPLIIMAIIAVALFAWFRHKRWL